VVSVLAFFVFKASSWHLKIHNFQSKALSCYIEVARSFFPLSHHPTKFWFKVPQPFQSYECCPRSRSRIPIFFFYNFCKRVDSIATRPAPFVY
jgi:hypothetical protein